LKEKTIFSLALRLQNATSVECIHSILLLRFCLCTDSGLLVQLLVLLEFLLKSLVPPLELRFRFVLLHANFRRSCKYLLGSILFMCTTSNSNFLNFLWILVFSEMCLDSYWAYSISSFCLSYSIVAKHSLSFTRDTSRASTLLRSPYSLLCSL
jgi:hypothetical protein